MEEEIKQAFEITLDMKILQSQRLSGEDFLKVAVPIIVEFRKGLAQKGISDIDNRVRKVATYMVNYFNNKLNPKMDSQNVQNTINILSGNNPILNMFL